jgi:N-acetylglucosaminylphosphatidylinositol deacetylase
VSQPQSVLLVIAHPDDEAMFFIPALLSLQALGYQIAVLCLSNGDFIPAQSLIRPQELRESLRYLGISAERLHMLEPNRAFADGPQVHWSAARIAAIIDDYIARHPVDILLSFDEWGISQHPNHQAVYHGLVYWGRQRRSAMGRMAVATGAGEAGEAGEGKREGAAVGSDIQLWALETCSLWRKFLGLIDACLMWWWPPLGAEHWVFITPLACFIVWGAMLCHRSQLLWFRCLFVWFSRYSYLNSLRRIF